MARRVILIGPPGSGKSSVGAQLAERMDATLRDTDADVVGAAGRTISEIFVTDGEQAFRALERQAVADALASEAHVVSLGGGAPMAPATQDLLRAEAAAGAAVVFLDMSLAEAMRRLKLDASRPLLVGSPRQQWTALMAARRPIYEDLATMTVLTDGVSPHDLADQIMEALT